MDVWLLATQLLLSQAAIPSPGASPTLAFSSALLGHSKCIAPLATSAGAGADCPGPTMGAIAAPAHPPGSTMEAAAAGSLSEPGITVNRPPAIAPGPAQLKPVTGSQLYQFRAAVLGAGDLYARAVPERYIDQWQRALDTPTYNQWRSLLAAEATAMASRQGQTPLTIVVGDSLALWLPLDPLPVGQLWLNQSISGETAAQMRQRLHYFAATQPRAIHVMAGINDLKQGATEAEVVDTLAQMLAQLKQQHPQAKLVIYSILPTRLQELPSDRIQRVNHRLAALAAAQGATYVDLFATFSDPQGQLRLELTTDGLHLSAEGYSLWQAALARY